MKMKKQLGMSVIEIAVVIMVVGILTAIIIISRNPNSETLDKKAWQRQADLDQIAQVVHQYKIHNNDKYPKTNEGDKIPDCQDNTTPVSSLSNKLVTDYLNEIPRDPVTDNEYNLCLVDSKVKVIAGESGGMSQLELIR
jgi:type II secretory pathway pseudopilin PulG